MSATGPKNVAAVVANLERVGALETMEQIRREYRLTYEELLGGDRHKTAAAARHHLWLLIKHTLDLSYPEMARIFFVDHTTVLTGVRKAERVLGLSEVA